VSNVGSLYAVVKPRAVQAVVATLVGDVDHPARHPFKATCSSSSVGGTAPATPSLLPGIYTLVLSDANCLPFAVRPGPPSSSLLSDGFADLSAGVFQTCNSSGACLSDINGNFAADITGVPLVATPEPRSLLLLAGVLAALWPRISRLAKRAGDSSAGPKQ
jgi:hypothetical protein